MFFAWVLTSSLGWGQTQPAEDAGPVSSQTLQVSKAKGHRNILEQEEAHGHDQETCDARSRAGIGKAGLARSRDRPSLFLFVFFSWRRTLHGHAIDFSIFLFVFFPL